MSNLENEITSDKSSESNAVETKELNQSYSSGDVDTFSPLTVDAIFRKKLDFLGLAQQIIGVTTIIVCALYMLLLLPNFRAFGGFYLIVLLSLSIMYIIIGVKFFKSGKAYRKSILTLESNNLKEGLIIFSGAMKLYLILIIIGIVSTIIMSIQIVPIIIQYQQLMYP